MMSTGRMLWWAIAVAAGVALTPAGCVDDPEPAVGQSCEAEAEVTACAVMLSHTDTTVTCAVGTSTCVAGQWSACDDTTVVERDYDWANQGAPGYTTQNLGNSALCADNPCNIYCNNFEDDPQGITPPSGMEVTPGGLTLTTTVSNINADGLLIVPDVLDVVVTEIPDTGPLGWLPDPAEYQAWFTNAGVPIQQTQATWSLSTYDYSLIDSNGLITVVEPVPHFFSIVQATAATYSDTAALSVTVDTLVTSGSPGQAIIDQFEQAPGGSNTTDVIYPYDNSVFPRAMVAPRLMWNASDNADWVKYCLIFADPNQGNAVTFRWCKIEPESSPRRGTFSQRAWAGFDTTASGQAAVITLQRIVGGSQVAQVTVPFTFSTEPMRGTVYFWDIGARNISKLTEDGTLTQAILPMPPGRDCIGCHSISADGTTLVGQAKGNDVRGTWGLTPVSLDSYTAPKFEWVAASPTGAFTLGVRKSTGSGFTAYQGYLLDSYSNTSYANILPLSGRMTSSSFSPLGGHVAYALHGGNNGHEICTFDITLANPYPVTNHVCLGPSPDGGRPYINYPTFTPDGEYIGFNTAQGSKNKDGQYRLHGVRRDGANMRQLDAANGLGAGNAPAADWNYNGWARISPLESGGYNWMLFASKRSYGNLLANKQAIQLWISAVDLNAGGDASDPSHPAFYLPGQPFNTPNLEPFFTKSPCLADAASCQTNEDCCGYDAADPPASTSKCVIDQPIAQPLTRSCTAFTPNQCNNLGGVCVEDLDCCGFPTNVCILGICALAEQPPVYGPATFTREYEAVCPDGSNVSWTLFKWRALTPGDSNITFTASTADTQPELAAAPFVALATAVNQTGLWNLVDVASKLPDTHSRTWLRVDMTLNPTSDQLTSPTLIEWTQMYDCLENE